MNIDPRLDEIDDCLYRVASRAVIVQGNKVLLVKEIPEMWWGFVGGGVDVGETPEESMVRELKEELGVEDSDIESDFEIKHYEIGMVVNGVPRLNLFFKVSLKNINLSTSDEVSDWGWFDREEFMSLNLSPAYNNREKIADFIFG